MDPITIAALVGAGVQVVGGLISDYVRQGRIDDANTLLKAAQDKYGSVPLDEMTQKGLDETQMGKVATDPALRQAQMNALGRLKQIGEQGYTVEEQAALNKIRNDSAQADSARRASILSGMAARGAGGSGAELAMQLEGTQAAAQRENQAGLDVAAQAQRRALEAIRAQSAMAGEIRGEDFGEASSRAKAEDERARFNFGAARDATQYNNSLRIGQADRAYNMAKDQAATAIGQANATAQTIAGATNAAGQGLETWASSQKKSEKKDPNDLEP